MSSWHSYGKIYGLGHRAVLGLTKDEVLVEEKIDGSQFSFGLFECDDSYEPFSADVKAHELRVRSKGAIIVINAPDKMFTKACETVKKLASQLHIGWTYRGEYLAKPCHNALAYNRVPKDNIIIFDIATDEESYLGYDDKKREAERIGLEVVPRLFEGYLAVEDIRQFLTQTSILGGQLIEGVVIKPREYNLYGIDKKVLMGKFVSEAFKEVHSAGWKNDNPTGKDILSLLGLKYGTPTRWQKAVQHLKESGELVGGVKDIGSIIKEIPTDILSECSDDIKDELMQWAWPHIRRLAVRGFAEWYKEKLLVQQFNAEEDQ